MSRARVYNILMERDRMTKSEATDVLNDVLSEVNDLIDEGRFQEAEDTFCSQLDTEPDYFEDILIEPSTQIK